MLLRKSKTIRMLPWAVVQAGLLLAVVQPLPAHHIDAKAEIHPTAVAIAGITANTAPDRLYFHNYCWIGMNATLSGAPK